MRAGEMFKDYRKMKLECTVLKFQMEKFEGVPYQDVIESINYARPQGDKVQTGTVSDKTGKTAIIYRKVKERLDDGWFESLFERYQFLQEELSFFEYGITQLSGSLPEFVRDLVIEQMAWEELMLKYNVCHSMIGKYRKKAEKELDILYELRDKQAETYMLS